MHAQWNCNFYFISQLTLYQDWESKNVQHTFCFKISLPTILLCVINLLLRWRQSKLTLIFQDILRRRYFTAASGFELNCIVHFYHAIVLKRTIVPLILFIPLIPLDIFVIFDAPSYWYKVPFLCTRVYATNLPQNSH